MAEPRTPRDLVSREKTARSVYVPPSALPDPTPEPGYVYRYIATHVNGQADPANVSKRLREGWEPVKATDHPELALFQDKNGNVEVGGLMLCKMLKEQADARDRYYAEQARNQMSSVDNSFMQQGDPRMPLFRPHRETEVDHKAPRGFGSGSK
jgi:hypothetical protein